MGDVTEVQETETRKRSENKNRSERLLPNVSVRVLLVEADDSNRQIIAALLRKCSYKVTAVSDGLKALEVIKGRAHSIDLILTEVELPSISGDALLTLIMGHDVCKNIPVIMMSSQDSVSTVCKCMLRGATDFLVKPLRINELRNLWQHVWRKEASSASGPGHGPPKESLAQEKMEATAENNAVSNHSSGYMACLERNRECIERGSDAQSSCTKQGLETEGAYIEHTHTLSQPKAINRPLDFINSHAQEGCNQETEESRKTQATDKNFDDDNNNNNNNVPENLSREAIALIGIFDNNYLKGTLGGLASVDNADKLDSLPPLDLSLRRSHPSFSVNQVNDEKRRLNHSDASAFSRYRNKPLQPQKFVTITCNQQKDQKANSGKQISGYTPDYNSDRISSQKHISVLNSSTPLQRERCQPIPVKGIRIENVINGFVSTTPQIMYPPQSCPSPLPGPSTINYLQFPPHSHPSHQFYNSSTIDRGDSQKTDNLEDESGNRSFYTGNVDTNSISAVNEEGFNGASHGSMQRIAALNKFRQKRKDRCFEKKVRYESRKKLAEQRPRVKGQFVRQEPNSGSHPGS